MQGEDFGPIVVGSVLGLIAIVIRAAISTRGPRKILHQAEQAEKIGDFRTAAEQWKRLIFAIAANEQEVPMWLARLDAAYKNLGIDASTDETLEAHKIIVDIWRSKMSNSEKRGLHKSAMDSLKARLNALPQVMPQVILRDYGDTLQFTPIPVER